VDFDLRAGEVHVLAGENGAGKSTLIKILAGIHQDYRGRIELGRGGRNPSSPEESEWRSVSFAHPRDARDEGIATIHQELSLVPTMSVVDNLFLGREQTGRFGVRRHEQREQARQQLESVGLADLDPGRVLGSLPLAAQQLIEFAKALALGARIWILDEPSSALDDQDVEVLFGHIERLRREGCGIVYITHKMDELYRIADRITVLRDGCLVETRDAREFPEEALLRSMLGRELLEPGRGSSSDGDADDLIDAVGGVEAGDTADAANAVPKIEPRRDSQAPPLLSVQQLDIADPARPDRWAVKGFEIQLQPGEIVGLAGLAGSGRDLVLSALFGALPQRVKLEAELLGQPYRPRSPRAAIDRGVGYLPGDRKSQGILPSRSVLENASISSLDDFVRGGIWRRGFVDRRAERAAVAKRAEELSLKTPSFESPILALSGGNQQKVVLQRMLMTEPKLLLLDEPTRGVDVGAKVDVQARIRALAAEGRGVLWLSSSYLSSLLPVTASS
jgi:ribose transport system ATP-binding protein